MYRRRNSEIPRIPTAEHKEMPVVEDLISPRNDPHSHKHVDQRPEVIKPYVNVLHPELNRMYGSLRTEDGWKELIDNYSSGTLTTVAGSAVVAPVKLSLASGETRLSRWPGAVQLYLAIRSFSIASNTASFATSGSIDTYFVDQFGQTIPLGTFPNNDELNVIDCHYLIPSVITDAGNMLSGSVGSIQATLNAGATVGTYQWQIAFSYAYLLPTNKPYDVQHVEDLLDAHPGYTR